jgi:hypothetical protein
MKTDNFSLVRSLMTAEESDRALADAFYSIFLILVIGGGIYLTYRVYSTVQAYNDARSQGVQMGRMTSAGGKKYMQVSAFEEGDLKEDGESVLEYTDFDELTEEQKQIWYERSDLN